MIDRRFYESGAPLGVSDLERLTGAIANGDVSANRMFHGVATLADADEGCVSFCAGPAFGANLAKSKAGACFMSSAMATFAPEGCLPLVTDHPQYAYAMAAPRLVAPRISGAADGAVHPSAKLEAGVVVGFGATIGADAQIGRGTRIGAGAAIGPGVCVGRDGSIGPGAVIGFALLGDRVQVHAGAVIGEPGFGAAPGPRGLVSLPQFGRVILQDDVRIGANSCIDRGAWNDTVIGERTKIDNLVHVGHNVTIGRDCVLAAYSGISGSCVIGDGCMFGGRAGVIDHITIGDGARIAADSAVMKNVPAGESWAGSPARPIKAWLRQSAWLARAARQTRA